MGFWKKFNKTVGLGENNDLGRIGAAIGTGGVSEIATGGAKDLLLGKKAKDIQPDAIANQIRKTQSKGLTELNSALDVPAGDIVREQVERQKAGVLTSAQDARRNAQKLMAQQGLKGSSLGLSTNRSIDQQAGDNMASINAQTPGLIRDQALKDATTRISAGGINTAGMNFNKIEGQRSGGLLGIASALAPVAGTVAGFAAGGPAGAAMGSQIGSGIGGALAPRPSVNPYSPSNYSMGNFNF